MFENKFYDDDDDDDDDVYDNSYEVIMYDIDVGPNDVSGLFSMLNDETRSWYAIRRLNALVSSGPLSALVAAIIIDSRGRPWNSFLHPRDRFGRFIETGKWVRWTINNKPVRGYVTRIDASDGNITVRLDGNKNQKDFPDGALYKFKPEMSSRLIKINQSKADLSDKKIDLEAPIPNFPDASLLQRRMYNALAEGSLLVEDLDSYRPSDSTATDFAEELKVLKENGLIKYEYYEDDPSQPPQPSLSRFRNEYGVGKVRVRRTDIVDKDGNDIRTKKDIEIDEVGDKEEPEFEGFNFTKSQKDILEYIISIENEQSNDEPPGLPDRGGRPAWRSPTPLLERKTGVNPDELDLDENTQRDIENLIDNGFIIRNDDGVLFSANPEDSKFEESVIMSEFITPEFEDLEDNEKKELSDILQQVVINKNGNAILEILGYDGESFERISAWEGTLRPSTVTKIDRKLSLEDKLRIANAMGYALQQDSIALSESNLFNSEVEGVSSLVFDLGRSPTTEELQYLASQLNNIDFAAFGPHEDGILLIDYFGGLEMDELVEKVEQVRLEFIEKFPDEKEPIIRGYVDSGQIIEGGENGENYIRDGGLTEDEISELDKLISVLEKERSKFRDKRTKTTSTSGAPEAFKQMPPDPGTAPIPPGTVRLFHYVSSPGDLTSILENGILRRRREVVNSRHPRADVYGVGKEMRGGRGLGWATTTPPEYFEQGYYVEFYVDAKDYAGSLGYQDQAGVIGDVPPEQIISYNLPWFATYRDIEDLLLVGGESFEFDVGANDKETLIKLIERLAKYRRPRREQTESERINTLLAVEQLLAEYNMSKMQKASPSIRSRIRQRVTRPKDDQFIFGNPSENTFFRDGKIVYVRSFPVDQRDDFPLERLTASDGISGWGTEARKMKSIIVNDITSRIIERMRNDPSFARNIDAWIRSRRDYHRDRDGPGTEYPLDFTLKYTTFVKVDPLDPLDSEITDESLAPGAPRLFGVPESLYKEWLDATASRFGTDRDIDNPPPIPSLREAIIAIEVNEIVKGWANSSGDSRPFSVALQMRAREHFLDALDNDNMHTESMDEVDWDQVKVITKRDGVFIDAFLDAVYESTQKQLADAGLESIVLFRGIGMTPDDREIMTLNSSIIEKPPWVQSADKEKTTEVTRARIFYLKKFQAQITHILDLYKDENGGGALGGRHPITNRRQSPPEFLDSNFWALYGLHPNDRDDYLRGLSQLNPSTREEEIAYAQLIDSQISGELLHLDTVLRDSESTIDILSADVKMQPLSSFAYKREESQKFGNLVITVEVPASRVFSTALSGVGCLKEGEFVIFGGDTGAAVERSILQRDAWQKSPFLDPLEG